MIRFWDFKLAGASPLLSLGVRCRNQRQESFPAESRLIAASPMKWKTPMNISRFSLALVLAIFNSPVAIAQAPATSSPEALMDKMTGQWVLTGTIGKKATTHDVDVDWVLKRQYIRIHEVSRDKGADGGVGYEAWIYLVWDSKINEYAVMWLDNTAATNFAAEGVGHAKPDGDRIPIIYKNADGGGIHCTFAYDRAKDRWSWTIDNVDKAGKPSPFARVTLTRKQ